MTESTRLLAALAGLGICCFMLFEMIKADKQRAGGKVRISGTVMAHAASIENGVQTFATIIRYEVDGKLYEIVDDLWKPSRNPKTGHSVTLVYPEGYPALAYVPRPILRTCAYACVGSLAALMIVILASSASS